MPLPVTRRIYYEDSHISAFSAEVLDCAAVPGGFATVLDATAFFPGGGGQEADGGIVAGCAVTGISEKNGVIYHITEKKPAEPGCRVQCAVDSLTRLRRMQAHSGEHIISGLLYSAYGSRNVGFHIGENELVTIDTSLPLSRAQLEETEYNANLICARNLPVRCYIPSSEELSRLTYRSKIELTENVRIVEIEGVDRCACCAPHVAQTGEIGSIRLLDTQAWKGGVRMSVVCGLAALDDARRRYNSVRDISVALSSKQENVASAVTKLLETLESRRAADIQLRRELRELRLEKIPPANGNLSIFLRDTDRAELIEYASALAERCGAVGAAFNEKNGGFEYAAASRFYDMRALSGAFNTALHGRGGGSSDMIFGSSALGRDGLGAAFSGFVPDSTAVKKEKKEN